MNVLLLIFWPALIVGEPTPIPLVEINSSVRLVFDRDIFPIVESKCLTCHDKAGGLAEGDLDLTTLASITQGGKHGPAVQAGQGEASLAFLRSSRRLKPIMPPDGEGEPLSSEELTKFKIWIDQGALPGADLQPALSRKREIVWEALPTTLQPVLAVAFSPDGTKLAIARGNRVIVESLSDGSRIATFSAEQDLVSSLAWSPDGQQLAWGGHGHVRLGQIPSDGLPAEPITFEPVTERAVALAFSPDGSRLAVGAGVPSGRGEISIWSRADHTEILRLNEAHSDLVTGLAYSPDGQMLASCGADKFVKLFRASDGFLVRSLEGHTAGVLGIGWSGDSKQIASASADGTLKLWHADSGEQAFSQNDHRLEVTSTHFRPGRREIVTTSGDRLVRLWNADDSKPIRVYQGSQDFLLSSDFSSDGTRLAAGSQNGEVYLWNVDEGTLLRTFAPPAPPTASTEK
jgi:WD40 repeat protein